MKIQYASDLHLEFEENRAWLKARPLKTAGDTLVLAGDTIYFGKEMEEKAGWFFDWCSEHYRETFLIPGNHEYYGGYPMEETVEDFELKVRENVIYLNNRSVVRGDTEFFFTTLWTHIPGMDCGNVERVMNDCRLARWKGKRYSAGDWNRLHRTCTEWLANALGRSEARHRIVVSHHCPYMSATGGRYVGAIATSGYMTDMVPLMENLGIEYWIHGHIHIGLRGTCGHGLVVSNPFGYVDDGENAGFADDAFIETK